MGKAAAAVTTTGDRGLSGEARTLANTKHMNVVGARGPNPDRRGGVLIFHRDVF